MKKLLIMILLPSFLMAQKQDFSSLKAQKINAIASFQYQEAQQYTYARYTENYEDSVIIKIPLHKNSEEATLAAKYTSLLLANKDSVINQLILISKLRLSLNQEEITGIKYRIIQKTDTSKIQILIIQKLDKIFTIPEKTNKTAEIIETILRLNNDAFSQFEYEEPLSQYPEFKSIANTVKDVDGTLNLAKLAKYLKTKPKDLEKYCDY